MNPWGKLHGVRPTKLVHYMWDEGHTSAEVFAHLLDYYGVSPEKAQLLVEVASSERSFLQQVAAHPDWVSIYIGIPFCPSRCTYCSFISYTLRDTKELRLAYVAALLRELEAVARRIDREGQQVFAVYIGGGTPTCLDCKSFSELLLRVQSLFLGSQTVEFTVEAGRPETITPEKLAAMQQYGVTRVSVNPQTMNQETLRRVGRHHTPDQVKEAAAQVKAAGFVLNMDMILGLPGEKAHHVIDTLRKVLGLRPHNITVHALALKRASILNLENRQDELPSDVEALGMANAVYALLAPTNYQPYYLYRQRSIVGGLENIGYCLPGYECYYNILMIEERMSIYACGAGGVSKILDENLRFSRLANPKDPHMYVDRIDDIIARKQKGGV